MNYELSDLVSLEFISPEDESFKFGYYYYSSLSADNDKLLAHRLNFEGRPVKKDDVVELGYFQLPEGKWIKIAETKAFNWQIGSMLQWLGPTFNNEVIFNDVGPKGYISKVVNLLTNDIRELPKAIHVCDKAGKYSYTLNYERANFTRAYNYESYVDELWDVILPDNDGVIKLNLKTGAFETITYVKQVLKFLKIEKKPDTYYWLEHVTLNFSDSLFSVYLRYGDKSAYTTRCVFIDTNGNIIGKHIQSDLESISHLGWLNENEYVIFTRRLSNLQHKLKQVSKETQLTVSFSTRIKTGLIKLYRSILKPIIPKGLVSNVVSLNSNYQLANVGGNRVGEININPGNFDGHPSFTKDGRFMLTDTYADGEDYRHLILFDTSNQNSYFLGKFFSTYNNVDWRTDLHPRFSFDENFVIIDSNHSGHNQVLILKMCWNRIHE